MTANCPRCPELQQRLEATRRQRDALQVDLDNANTDLVAKRREITRLKGTVGERAANDNANVRDVLDYWQHAYPEHRAKLVAPGKARYQRVSRVLAAGCTVQDCKRAVDGSKDSPWHQGANADRKPLTDVQHIFTNETMVERLRDRAEGRAEYHGPTGVAAILQRVDAVRRIRDGQWEARCPAHDDRKASLQVGQGEKGAVISCLAGCSAERVLGAVNLPLAALFGSDTVTVSRPAAELPPLTDVQNWHRALLAHPALIDRVRHVKGWDVRTLRHFAIGWDPADKRLMIPSFGPSVTLTGVLRYRPKADDKMKAWPGTRRDLFPAPELVRHDHVWLVEGEPDGVSAFQYGLPALAIPGVGFAMHPEKWAFRLKDRRVAVCFDCDDAGRDAAQRVARALVDVAREVRVVDLEPSRSDAFDLSDALVAGVPVGEIRGRAKAANAVLRWAA